MDSDFVVTQIASTTEDVSAALTGGIPLILIVFAALVGLGILLKYLKKWIGRKA